MKKLEELSKEELTALELLEIKGGINLVAEDTNRTICVKVYCDNAKCTSACNPNLSGTIEFQKI